ncbi:5-hydroxyisourate hydrolase [Thermocatellispora tengchongensis]|uniref:5-hydroxyisourate hydrolase n=1 Tax=Thermocatellispora tengchongensis TaxID=1073253 RepID=A0A840PJN0_9ACTN|nr:hydroxyisourate hydrolase [Thermocatellispora tengchongensis]MBB5138123.1 5-hydroxyisourate hydrolase [Thermocatellispora tengchongensis]
MTITAQAMDSVYGRSAAGLRARLEWARDGSWASLADAETDAEGRIDDWEGRALGRGLYRIVFDSDQYYVGFGVNAAYSEISVVFRMHDDFETCQIQVLMSPHSYSTYFGTLV